jgi:hypothetical protein
VGELLDLASPRVGRSAGLHDHCCLRPIHEEREKVLSRHAVALIHFAGAMGDRDLKDGLCQVYGDERIVTHEVAPFMPSQQRLWHIDADPVARGVHLINAADEAGASDVASLLIHVLCGRPLAPEV